MFSDGFLYRRLAGLVPCALRNVAGGSLVLRNKWQVSSLRDVFLSAHYWRLFDHLDAPPSLVVDLGGHCGHFVVLCDLVLEERFGSSVAQYLVVEGLEALIGNIETTLTDTGLRNRCKVLHGLVGRRAGSAQLKSGQSNLLDASVVLRNGVERGPEVPYLDLLDHIPENQIVDILKVDIEGSEFDLVKSYPTLLERTRLVTMEVHEEAGPADEVLGALEKAGLHPCLPHIRKGTNLLVVYKRPGHL